MRIRTIDCNGNDVTQESKDFINNLEERLIRSERQFENFDKCKQKLETEIYTLKERVKKLKEQNKKLNKKIEELYYNTGWDKAPDMMGK